MRVNHTDLSTCVKTLRTVPCMEQESLIALYLGQAVTKSLDLSDNSFHELAANVEYHRDPPLTE